MNCEYTSHSVAFPAKLAALHRLGAALPDAVRGFPVAIFAKYEDNVNTAVKGVAIAAERLREQGMSIPIYKAQKQKRAPLSLFAA